MDETGLNYRLLPRQTYIHKNEKAAKGTKNMKSKERVTLYIATNAMGSQKVPLAMIGTAKNPRCFGRNLQKAKFPYLSQQKAWSDTTTYKKWFYDVFLPHVRFKMKDKVLLIMDNCGPHAHAVLDPLNQVKVHHLPPNCTSVHQPMDQGIIAALKCCYRYQLLKKILQNFENREERRRASAKMLAGTAGLDEGREAHLYDAQILLHETWNDMETATITCCWAKSELLDPTTEADIVSEHGSRKRAAISNETKTSINEISELLNKLSIPDDELNQNDALEESVMSLVSMFSSSASRQHFAEALETWTELEETDDYKEMLEQEQCKHSENLYVESLIAEIIEENDSDEEEELQCTITSIDTTKMCNDLAECQQILESQGILLAAEYLEKARWELLHCTRNAQTKSFANKSRQTFMDAYLKPGSRKEPQDKTK